MFILIIIDVLTHFVVLQPLKTKEETNNKGFFVRVFLGEVRGG